MLTRLGTVAFDFYKWDHVKLGECEVHKESEQEMYCSVWVNGLQVVTSGAAMRETYKC